MSSVYIHVPFCKQRCAYCDFCSQTDLKKEKRYFLAIQKHIKSVADETFRVDSIYFGGGTPSVVDAKHIVETIETIRQSFTVVPDVEITVECNPESVTKEKILAYKESGVNRISIGLQTIHDETLKKINRIHTYAEAIEAVKIVNGCGIENVNVDLLLGLPDETEDMFFKSVFAVSNLPIKHVSIYALEVYPNTPLGKAKGFKYMNEDEVADAYYKAVELLKTLNFQRYEVSNFALDGYDCKHNTYYWKPHHYYGIGAGASGFVGDVRYTNFDNVDQYIQAIESGASSILTSDVLTIEDKMYEAVMLGLRREKGLNVSKFEKRFGKTIYEYCPKINEYLATGVLQKQNGRLFVRPDKIYVLNSILTELLS